MAAEGQCDKSCKVKLYISIVMYVLGMALMTTAIATRVWSEHEDIDANIGLWEVCLGDSCSSIEDASDALNAVRAFAIMSDILGALGLLVSLVCLKRFGGINNVAPYDMYKLTAALGITAMAFSIVSFVVYTTKINGDLSGYKNGWSYHLAAASPSGFGTAGFLMLSMTCYRGTRA